MTRLRWTTANGLEDRIGDIRRGPFPCAQLLGVAASVLCSTDLSTWLPKPR